jgi:chromosome segregation ATPase
MPEWAIQLLEIVVTALFAGAGGGFLVSKYKAKTERLLAAERAATDRIETVEEARVAATESTTEAWRTLTDSLQHRLEVVTDRLCEVERQLAIEHTRRVSLEEKIQRLERERDQWILERQKLILQIAEKGGGKQ